MVTRFEYDRAGRKTAEIAADGARDATEYDASGNAVAVTTRRGYRITMTYDVFNRLRTRTVPSTSRYSRFAQDIGYGAWFHFPFWGTNPAGNATVRDSTITVVGDTERFDYDLSGNLVYAANRDAVVRRRYNPNGTLAADTLVLATYATRDTTQHVYGLRYHYDVLGRRTQLVHPSNLAPAGGWTVHNDYNPVTGALTGVTDPVGAHGFSYNAAGQLTGEQYPNGVTESYSHDVEGRLRARTLTIPGMGVLDNDTMHYDQRGKLTYVQQRIGSVTNFYSGLGSLAWSRSSEDNYNYVEQGYVTDALGNTERTEKYDYAKRDYPSVHVNRNRYDPGTARLVRQTDAPGFSADTTGGGTMTYDPAGNNTYSTDGREYYVIRNSRRVEAKASYYDAADRLRIVDRRACAWMDSLTAMGEGGGFNGLAGNTTMRCVALRTGDGSAFEEYRYDALGRRVLVRTQQECTATCIETVTRTVWDGDRLLWEIRAPGGHIEQDVVPPGQLGSYNITTGRVAYTFGSALDHPLAVHRFDYRDSVFTKYDTVPVPLNMQPLTIYPHTNWRGDYQIGTFVTGETKRCARAPTTEQDHETVDGSQPGGGSSIYTWHWHCLAPVPWPGKYIWLDHSVRAAPPGNPDLWVGSLVKNKRDLTGNLYMRNRYYDAQAGRFSQEDPIGLAGGLNAYGFAAGDPVTYSDPYGLAAQDCCRGLPLPFIDVTKIIGVLETIVFGPPGDPNRTDGAMDSPGLFDPVGMGSGAAAARLSSRGVVAARGAAGDNVGLFLRAEVRMTRWGWSGSAKYQSTLDAVGGAANRATLGADDLGGILPTRQEAERMIADTGGRVLRVERGHTTGRGHATPHINYETSSGNRATILVESVGRQYRAPRQ